MTAYQVASPISHLFKDAEQARAIIAHSDCLESRDHNVLESWPDVRLFHTDVEPTHEIPPSGWEHLHTIRARHADLRLLSMHVSSCCSAPRVVDGRFQPGGVTYTRDDLLANARHNVARIRAIFGPSVVLVVENNNYYPTPAYEHVCDPDFLSDLVEDNNLRFLFDIAHAHIAAINRQVAYSKYRDGLPLSAAIQVHLSQHAIAADGSAFDAHHIPGPEIMREFQEVLASSAIEFVTVEYYRELAPLVQLLDELRRIRSDLLHSSSSGPRG